MTEPYAGTLRASYDAVLDELQAATDVGSGLADLRARLAEQQTEADVCARARIQVHIADRHALPATAPGGADIRYFTVAEAALILHVSKMTIYRLVHSGELEAIRVGRSFRIPGQALRVFLADRLCPPEDG